MIKPLLFVIFFVTVLSTVWTQAPVKRLRVHKFSPTLDDWQNVLFVFEGVLKGIGAQTAFNDVVGCIDSSETIIQDFNDAIKDFKAENLNGVIQGIEALTNAVKVLPNAITQCGGVIQDAEKLIKMISNIKNPKSFAFHVAKDIIYNGVNIYYDITKAVSDYENLQWESFGEDIGRAFNSILGITPYTATTQVTAQDVLEIAEGILFGIGAKTNYQDIERCIKTNTNIIEDIVQAVQDFETQQQSKVLAGIKLIGEAIEIVPDAITECGGAAADAEKLYKVLAAFKSPTSLIFVAAKNLVLDGVEIYGEITSAVNDFKEGDYVDFGENIGKALATVLFGSPQLSLKALENYQVDPQDILLILKGVLEGVGTQTKFQDINECIDISSQITDEFTNAVEDLAKNTVDDVRKGLILIGEAVQALPDAIQDCKGAEQDTKNLLIMIQAFKNPTTFIYDIAKSLLLNGREIYHYITSAVSAYKNQQWEQFGQDVGQALAAVIFGGQQKLNTAFGNFVNQRVGWDVDIPKKFEGMTLNEISNQYLGAILVDLDDYNITRVDYSSLIIAQNLPDSFNAYEQWPQCAHSIRDQGDCGSCWAFAASETISDRFCIASNGTINFVFSPQWLVSCNDILNRGCNGGSLPFAWWFLEYDGIVSDTCLPYESSDGQNFNCPSTCADGSKLQKYYTKLLSTQTFSNAISIKTDILQYGPVETGFTVYEDFMYYTGGIYIHTSGSYLGGHAVKIVGWGNENGTEYWIVANSWGTTWGENGFFRIALGQCGIDNDAIAGRPKI